MNNLDEKYYDGFEGSPEIIISVERANGEKREIGIWFGYFMSIIDQIEPEAEGWTGLAYYHHLDLGWYDESPWLIENLIEVYEQLNKINKENLPWNETKEILEIILDMLKEAIDNNNKVFISYD